ncbi:hypothetical protein TNCV_1658081 [Trichonephila clavipes]|nr:hypothetical protein TNCV_1658081 [Trichonephila clavipes]
MSLFAFSNSSTISDLFSRVRLASRQHLDRGVGQGNTTQQMGRRGFTRVAHFVQIANFFNYLRIVSRVDISLS